MIPRIAYQAEAMFIRLETLLSLLYHDGLSGANDNGFNLADGEIVNTFSQCLTWARMGRKIVARAQEANK